MALESLSPTGPGPRRRRIESGSRSSNARARIMRGPAAKSDRWTTPREQSGRGGSTDWQQATARRRWACENWQSVSLFFFDSQDQLVTRFGSRDAAAAQQVPGWLVGFGCVRRTDRPQRPRQKAHTHTPPLPPTLSLPPLPLLPLRPGPGAAAWNGSLGPALQFYDPVLRTTVHVRSAGPDDSSHSAQGEPRGQFPSRRLSAARQCWWARNADQRCSGR